MQQDIKRLSGMATTPVPVIATEGARAIYDVTEEADTSIT